MMIGSALALFASTFLLVFALGLQSQFVNNGHYRSAFFNSLMISTSNLLLFKLAPDATGWEIAGFICGGPFGIVASMWLYRIFSPKPAMRWGQKVNSHLDRQNDSIKQELKNGQPRSI